MDVEIVKETLNHARIAARGIMKSNILWKMNGLAVIDVLSKGIHGFSRGIKECKKRVFKSISTCKKDLNLIDCFFMQIDDGYFWLISKEYDAMKGRTLQ